MIGCKALTQSDVAQVLPGSMLLTTVIVLNPEIDDSADAANNLKQLQRRLVREISRAVSHLHQRQFELSQSICTDLFQSLLWRR